MLTEPRRWAPNRTPPARRAATAPSLRLTVRGAYVLYAALVLVVLLTGLARLADPAGTARPPTGQHVAPGVALGMPAVGAAAGPSW